VGSAARGALQAESVRNTSLTRTGRAGCWQRRSTFFRYADYKDAVSLLEVVKCERDHEYRQGWQGCVKTVQTRSQSQ
jgi:hypothetical protein